MKALCELPPSAAIIIIMICRMRGLDQWISTGSSPALMLRISVSELGVDADYCGVGGAGRRGVQENPGSVGLEVPGNLCKQISPVVLFSQPSLGC